MDAKIFVPFDEKIKKVIDLSIEGYVRPVVVYYGFTGDRSPDNDTVWYNLKGNPGSEISRDLYTRMLENDPPVFVFEGFKVKINPFQGFKKIIYRVSYCYKYKNTHDHDLHSLKDDLEVYYCDTPPMDFWDAVTY